MNITNFLSKGESSLYTRKAGIRSIASVLIPLTISMLTACTVVQSQGLDATQLGSSNFVATSSVGTSLVAIAKPNLESKSAYKIDGNTLLLQAMIDPSMSKIRAASSTSEVLEAYISSLPSAVQAESMRGLSTTAFANQLKEESPDGRAISAHVNGEVSACIVLAFGTSRDLLPDGTQSTYIDFKDALYVAPGDNGDVTTLIHEITHCIPNKFWADGNHPLSRYYQSSIRETRSDLAVVLYGASQTGSFNDGIAYATALRGENPQRPTHATIELLETITKELDPQSYVGMSPNQVIESAVSIINGLDPEHNLKLKHAFAKDAWTYKSISVGLKGLESRPANSNYAEFAGTPFDVDLKAHANKIITRSLDYAILQADVVRASGVLTVARVEQFARNLGVTLSEEQRVKAEFVDGSLTPLGATMTRSGEHLVTHSPFTKPILEATVQGDLKSMITNGVISLSAGPALKAPGADMSLLPNRPSLRSHFEESLSSFEGATLHSTLEISHIPRGPGM